MGEPSPSPLSLYPLVPSFTRTLSIIYDFQLNNIHFCLLPQYFIDFGVILYTPSTLDEGEN